MVYNVCYVTSMIVLKQCAGGEGGGQIRQCWGMGTGNLPSVEILNSESL